MNEHRLTKIGQTIGFTIDFFPYSLPPTEQELQIDWSQIIRIDCSFKEEEWQVFMSQIHKFPKLTELEISSCSLINLTSAQLSLMTNLKKIVIQS